MNPNVSFLNGRLFGNLLGWDPVWSAFPLPLDVNHTDDMATVSVDMPGVDPQDVELTFEAGTLSIVGKRGDQTYRYSVALGDVIDPNHIEAQLDKGVLVVQAHKRPETKPRKILIGASSQKTLDTGDSK